MAAVVCLPGNQRKGRKKKTRLKCVLLLFCAVQVARCQYIARKSENRIEEEYKKPFPLEK